jgi:hypothetical protein
MYKYGILKSVESRWMHEHDEEIVEEEAEEEEEGGVWELEFGGMCNESTSAGGVSVASAPKSTISL